MKPESVRLVLRYLLIGGVTFFAYFALLYFCASILGLRYPTSVTIAYIGALAIHFSANRTFTFRSTNHSVAVQILRYVVTAAVNYGLQVLAIFVLYHEVGMNFYLAALIAVFMNLVVGFVLQLRWVFVVRSV